MKKHIERYLGRLLQFVHNLSKERFPTSGNDVFGGSRQFKYFIAFKVFSNHICPEPWLILVIEHLILGFFDLIMPFL